MLGDAQMCMHCDGDMNKPSDPFVCFAYFCKIIDINYIKSKLQRIRENTCNERLEKTSLDPTCLARVVRV